MPRPKRASVGHFLAQLDQLQRPHLGALRELSFDADPEAREELKWNVPVYVRDENTNLWMLLNFKSHCSLRFSPPFLATHKAAVEAAGHEAGEGFIKLPYNCELPTALRKALMQARVEDYETTHASTTKALTPSGPSRSPLMSTPPTWIAPGPVARRWAEKMFEGLSDGTAFDLVWGNTIELLGLDLNW